MLLHPGLVPPDVGWRLCFGLGAVLGLGILVLRRHVPESPRWLMVHGRIGEATQIMDEIEARIVAATGRPLAPVHGTLRLIARGHTSLREVARTLIRRYPQRTVLGIVLIASQAFFYNAIFFTYALVLRRFYGIEAASVGWYLLPFALGNFTGPLLLGHWFDTIGRRPMIAGTYALSGVLLAIVAAMFGAGMLDATTQTVAWSVIFFFASAAASAAYLTISESFPLEVRAIAIALFYAGGTLLGGVAAPWLFGHLIASGERRQVVWGSRLARCSWWGQHWRSWRWASRPSGSRSRASRRRCRVWSEQDSEPSSIPTNTQLYPQIPYNVDLLGICGYYWV